MKIEFLFPEICNLFGDAYNVTYLKKCCPEVEVIETLLTDTPRFLSEPVDLVYFGMTTENGQKLIVEKLLPHVEKIKELIANGQRFLVTGNAIEVFGKQIQLDELTIDCLGIFDFTSKGSWLKRFNCINLCDYTSGAETVKVVGFKSLFCHSYPEEGAQVPPLFHCEKGPGLNPGTMEEGIHVNNFMATYMVGPLLVMNPPFTRLLLKDMGCTGEPVFEDAAMDAYNIRLKEYEDPKLRILY